VNSKNFPESSLETFKELAYITYVCMLSKVFILHNTAHISDVWPVVMSLLFIPWN